jgi:hypothetical protein
MMVSVRCWFILAAALTACESHPSAAGADPTKADWYAHTVDQLAESNRAAEALFEKGQFERAGDLVEKAQPLANRLLAVPHPTLAAAEAASDLDDLYGRMLMRNRHYGWARLLFQKNLSRWRHWTPQTPETERRFKQAQTAIEEVDKHLVQ